MSIKKQAQQFEFTSILEESFKQYEKRILSYMEANHERYTEYALNITPKLSDLGQVYSRVCFAILSANSPFDDTVRALKVCTEKAGRVKPADIAMYKMVPAKAHYVNRAYLQIHLKQFRPKLARVLDWNKYRLEVKEQFIGLHYAKASFTLGLLYPTTADVACIDTWIQKVFLGHTGFKNIKLETYLIVEQKIRSYAQRFNIGTFLAQWLIWDFARGSSNSHDIFPGNHKNSTVAIAA